MKIGSFQQSIKTRPIYGSLFMVISGLILMVLTGCSLGMEETATDDLSINNKSVLGLDTNYRSLAEFWAPHFYQDTDDTNYKADVLTKFNFDGDYVGKNNWENLSNYNLGDDALKAYVYYSVVETDTFYFIGYYTFHPRDWENINSELISHENDLEGVLLAIKKTDGYGTLVCAITESHNHFYQYRGPGQSLTNGSDDIDGTLLMNGNHAKIFIQAKAHGVYRYDGSSAPGGDGIVYIPDETLAQSPTNCSGNWIHQYNYQLIAMDNSSGDQGFWYRRNEIGDSNTFASWGVLRGDTYSDNAAKMPWAWDDPDDGEVFSGDLLVDPAHLIDCQLNGSALNGLSHHYICNIFATHSLEIIALRSDKNRDPFGGKSDIYLKVTVPGALEGTNNVLDARAWKKNSATVGTYYGFSYGGYQAEGQKTYSEMVRTHYFCRQGNPPVTFTVYDSDTDSDDAMGTVSLRGTYNYSQGLDLGDARIKFRLIRY